VGNYLATMGSRWVDSGGRFAQPYLRVRHRQADWRSLNERHRVRMP